MVQEILSTASAAKHPPFRVHRPHHQSVPLVFSSPHSGRDYPDTFVKGARLDPISLRRSEDSFIDELFGKAPNFGAPLLCALFPRAFVDVNREPFELDPAMFSEKLPGYVNTGSPRVIAGLGTIARVVSNGQEIYPNKLAFKEAVNRINNFYRPYHRALEKLIADTREKFGHCVLIDCHSMPSTGGPLDPDKGNGRADFIIGDCFGRSCAAYITNVIDTTISKFGYRVARNKPFAGGYTTQHYGKPNSGVHVVQIEINRALYMDEMRIRKNKGFEGISAELTNLIASLVNVMTQDLAAE